MQMETLPSGTTLHGRYRIERALGSGGFGHVYLSVDLQTNTQYAVKEYLVTGANGKAQLEHEAQVLSQLHHPSLPAFQDAFDERGHYYIVLGYIEGNDLTDYIRVVRQKNEVIPLARLMGWLLSISDAVAFLHSQRPPVIHRDIKPDNIRITPGGTATLVDLGNAKSAADGARTLFFIRHQGTPGYAPLEQYPGGTGTDERSDIYALGGTLSFALTAHEPPSVSARNQALQQRQPDLPSLQDQLARNPPDGIQEQRQFRLGVSKPSKPAPRHSRHLAQLGTLPPELLRKLDAIIHRAMAMRPKDRYQTVAEFSYDLRAVIQALPSSTLPPTSQECVIDIHSTQPDLPMLYEAIQNAQAAAAKQDQPQPASLMSSTTPPVAGPPLSHCPRCGTELTRPAPYCPRCGNALKNSQAQNQSGNTPGNAGKQTSAGSSRPPVEQNITEEATMLIPPRTPLQQGSDRATGLSYSPSAPKASQAPNFRSGPVASVTSQIQSQVTQQEQIRPVQSRSHNGVRPFFTSPSTTNIGTTRGQVPLTPASPQTTQTNSQRKIFLTLAIVAVALIIVILILVTSIRGHHIGVHNSDWLDAVMGTVFHRVSAR